MIADKDMNVLKRFVDATFENCNTKEAEDKLDVLECMCNVFNSITLKKQ